LPYVLDPNEQKVLADIRKAYDYYHHMDQQANHADVIFNWLVDEFAIASTVAQCRAQIARIKKSGVQQIAIISYSCPGEDREATIREFAKAMA
jgi:5,10-methylenetetrahydromethanopterin reductase